MTISPHTRERSGEGTTGSTPSIWEASARLYDYRQAANPIRPGLTEPIPDHRWDPPALGGSGCLLVPLDLSKELGCGGPATSPGLAAHYLRLAANDPFRAEAACTTSLFYVMAGRGRLAFPDQPAPWCQPKEWRCGDVFVLPNGFAPQLVAEEPSLLYWVHDGPLLRYLGAAPVGARFSPCFYTADRLERELARLLADPSAARSNRLSVLLAHAELPATRTVSHTLWAMVGVVPPGAIQPPHRHQSVAIDLVLDCAPGCHTLVGTELQADGRIRNPRRMDWNPGAVFVTPPGHWHAHVNPSEQAARLLPIQDAGLHTYLRSLDIRFSGGLAGEE